METTSKTRIQAPGRSAGDGMENSSSFPELNGKTSVNNQHQIPFTGLHNRPFVPPPNKLKGPKFVPYEPYKAAVSPIVPTTNQHEKHHTPSNFVIDSQKVSSLASSIIELYSNLENKDPTDISHNFQTQKCTSDHISKIKALEDKIKILEKENKELASQHQVQTEVNADLKKMLVASLGEDVQCKIQYMTEDKAHLGKEVLQLSEELEQSNEETEKLSVQCDIWESKFKASSLMVKELAQWKSSLSARLNDSITAFNSVLKEHDALFEELCATHSILEQTLNAFDPSAKQTHKKQDSSPNILKLVMELKSLSCSIQERLLGKLLYDEKHIVCGMRQLTRAETIITKLFDSFDQISPGKDLSLLKDPKLNDGRIACQILPHICENDMNVNFCKHCSGKIETI